MAFANKTDFCGLVAATTPSGGSAVLVIRSANENATAEKYQPQGQDGSFLATEVFGADSAPSNAYGLKANLSAAAGAIKLNKVTVIGTGDNAKNYALESLTIKTSAGAAPTVDATCQEIEAGATDAAQCHYSVPAFAVTTKHHAQDIFSALVLSGSGCSFTELSATIGGSINKDKVEGVKISSDINSGVITITGTVLQTGDTAPTLGVTSNAGWVITGPLNCTNPEAAYKSYSFEVQKVLAKDAVVGGGDD